MERNHEIRVHDFIVFKRKIYGFWSPLQGLGGELELAATIFPFFSNFNLHNAIYSHFNFHNLMENSFAAT